jgi:hypothetical protein
MSELPEMGSILKKRERKPSVLPEDISLTVKGLDKYMLPKPVEIRRIAKGSKQTNSEPSSPKRPSPSKRRSQSDDQDRITAPNLKSPTMPERTGPSVGESLRATLAKKRWATTTSKILAVSRLAHPLGGNKGAFGLPIKPTIPKKDPEPEAKPDKKENESKPPSSPKANPAEKKRRRRRRDSMLEEVNKPMVETAPSFVMPRQNQNLTFPDWLIDS